MLGNKQLKLYLHNYLQFSYHDKANTHIANIRPADKVTAGLNVECDEFGS